MNAKRNSFGKKVKNTEVLKKENFIKVTRIDRNLIESRENGYTFINVLSPFFSIGGLIHPSQNCNEFYRLDASRKDIYSDQNKFLAHCTSGAQVRFCTDASSVKIKITLKYAITGMNHFTNRGVYGIDIYTGTGSDRNYTGEVMQTFAESSTYNEGVLALPSGRKEVLINLPLYSGVESLLIGFPDISRIAPASKRLIEKPVAFYGSSITQGGCASRPGNMYSHILCRAFDADCMNMGFSGSAMGEQSVAEFIASREMSAFVMDYDYNSPSAESLEATHEPFFKTVRNAHPDLPVIFVTHPYYAQATENDIKRKNVVKKTYENAVAAGDKNVYFVDSEEFFPQEMRDLFAVDNLHPNDLGFYMMAKAIYPALKEALDK